MNKLTIKKIPFKFYGPIIEKGATLDFKFINSKEHEESISNIKGMKLISFFPDINTKICDAQTQWIMEHASKSDIQFISISTNSVKEQQKWCAIHGLDNVSIVSDAKFNDFGKKTGLLIPKIKKLGRGFMVLDSLNKIIDLTINKEVAEDPDFSVPQKYL